MRPKALDNLAIIQEAATDRKLLHRLFNDPVDPRPDDPISDYIPRGMAKNYAAVRNPQYRHLMDMVPLTQDYEAFAILQQEKQFFDRLILRRFRNHDRYCLSEDVYFGTLERWNANEFTAQILPVPGCDEYLVIIDQLFWDALALVTHIVIESVTPSRDRLVFDPRVADRYLVWYERLIDAVDQQSVFEPPAFVHRTQTSWWSWQNLRHSANSFVVGHEYGHFLHRHFSRNTAGEMGLGLPGSTLGGCVASWAQEFEADRTGMDLSGMLYQELGIGRAFFGPPLLRSRLEPQQLLRYMEQMNGGIVLAMQGILTALHVLSNIELARGHVHTSSFSHPPTDLRIVMAWHTFRYQLDEAIDTVRECMLAPIADCLTFLSDRTGILTGVDERQACESRLQRALFGTMGEISTQTLRAYLKDLMDRLQHDGASAPATGHAGQLEGAIADELELMERCMPAADRYRALAALDEMIEKTCRVFGRDLC
jgi:hypothetical protein